MAKRGLRVLAFGYEELERIPEDIDSVISLFPEWLYNKKAW